MKQPVSLGHAYTILSVAEAEGNKLLCLRNPWGKFEWKGDWSDDSPLWTSSMKRAIKPTFSPDDGVFWMAWHDFLKYFDSINVCFTTSPDGLEWEEDRKEGFFVKDGDDSFGPEHVYEFTLKTQTNVHAAVHQADTRNPSAEPYIEFGVMILDSEGQVMADSSIARSRETNCPAELEAGTYRVVPYTCGYKMNLFKRDRSRFMVSLHADQDGGSCLTPVAHDPAISHAARTQVLLMDGKAKSFDKGLYIYSLAQGPVYTYAVVAKEGEFEYASATVTMDFSSSQNVASHKPSLKHAVTVKAGDLAVMQHLGPIEDYEGYSMGYGMSWRKARS